MGVVAGAVSHMLVKSGFESKWSNDWSGSDYCHRQKLPKTFDETGIEVASAQAQKKSYV